MSIVPIFKEKAKILRVGRLNFSQILVFKIKFFNKKSFHPMKNIIFLSLQEKEHLPLIFLEVTFLRFEKCQTANNI